MESIIASALALLIAGPLVGAPTDAEGRPLIEKLGTIDADIVEATPIVFKGKVFRFEWIRKDYHDNQLGVPYFRLIDHLFESPLYCSALPSLFRRVVLQFRKIANPKLSDGQREAITGAVNINNSDIDFCEFEGRLIISYSWGDQNGIEFLAEATYAGTEREFVTGWFPETEEPEDVE